MGQWRNRGGGVNLIRRRMAIVRPREAQTLIYGADVEVSLLIFVRTALINETSGVGPILCRAGFSFLSECL